MTPLSFVAYAEGSENKFFERSDPGYPPSYRVSSLGPYGLDYKGLSAFLHAQLNLPRAGRQPHSRALRLAPPDPRGGPDRAQSTGCAADETLALVPHGTG